LAFINTLNTNYAVVKINRLTGNKQGNNTKIQRVIT